ncbi:hypothetical protein AVL62_13600 [Serinicoccus chungangensis]|uniref:Thioredoxin domain-containing protein n=1 Tax=Serinicoccus chungangensis TaxID=767452 RepID=A0A0W8IBY1_9MICO|nr:DUF899 family protein [Serinicoccus chungangensis]KUG57453.1 hypothetical protein AVL62_13600 [Serinicoccus chungangensis]
MTTSLSSSSSKADQPDVAPPVVDRAAFEAALAEQVAREKEVTRLNDRVSAARRRLPMVEVEDYAFDGPDGPVRLTELFDGHYLLLVQNVMFGPDWEEGCPSCTWAVDTLPARMERLEEEGIAFAMISQAPVEKLERWRTRRGWSHTWVSSGGTTYHHDWGWNREDEDGQPYQLPGYSYYLLRDGVPYLTYATTARGTEATLPVAHIMDRTAYGRQQDWEDSPQGWPQYPTYG